jgi:hypothetical protein
MYKDLARQHNSPSGLKAERNGSVKIQGGWTSTMFHPMRKGAVSCRVLRSLCSSVIRQKDRENSTVTICALTRPNP